MMNGNTGGCVVMRGEVLGLGFAVAVLFSGPLPELKGSLMRAETPVPAWLPIPAGASVAEIDYSGLRGMIRLSVDGEVSGMMTTIKTRLALRGFVVGERQFAHALTGIVTASNPATGQTATLLRSQGLMGEELRIGFIENSVAAKDTN